MLGLPAATEGAAVVAAPEAPMDRPALTSMAAEAEGAPMETSAPSDTPGAEAAAAVGAAPMERPALMSMPAGADAAATAGLEAAGAAAATAGLLMAGAVELVAYICGCSAASAEEATRAAKAAENLNCILSLLCGFLFLFRRRSCCCSTRVGRG